MAKALILGISGGTGRAIARALLDARWEVVGTGRCRDRFPEELAAAGAGFIESDRHDPHQLARVLAGGADVVVDCVCYTAEQASWLVTARLLDGRTAVPLAHDGLTANHPTAAVNLAALVAFCAAAPGTQVLNAADPGAPTAADIATAIAAAMGVELSVVRLPTYLSAELGRNRGTPGHRSC